MEELLLKLFNRSISAGWLIVLVIVLRLILRRLPKRSRIFFWGIVGLRLVIPFLPESMFSMIPSAQAIPAEDFRSGNFHVHSGVAVIDTRINDYIKSGPAQPSAVPAGSTVSWMQIFCVAWVLGAVLLFGYALASYVRLRRKVSASIPVAEPCAVRGCEDQPSERTGIPCRANFRRESVREEHASMKQSIFCGREERPSDRTGIPCRANFRRESVREEHASMKLGIFCEREDRSSDRTGIPDRANFRRERAGERHASMKPGIFRGHEDQPSERTGIRCGANFWRERAGEKSASMREEKIRMSDEVDSPFILGIWKPAIYLPSGMESPALEYVLAHERAHLRRRDHIWKLTGYLLLCVYWFNPLVWAAYLLLCRDIELACDEEVVADYDWKHRKAYAAALVDCSMQRKLVAVCPLAFGEIGVKERVMTVLKYKKPAFWVVIFSVVLCLAVGITFLTDPKTEAGDAKKTETGRETDPDQDEKESEAKTAGDRVNELEVRQPQVSLSDSTGADPAMLLYSDKEKLVFSGYYGLFTYSKTRREILSALDLSYISCDKTQGDAACEKVVSSDGNTAYLHPLSDANMYVYEMDKERLSSQPYDKSLFDKLGRELQEKRVVWSDDTGETVDQSSLCWYENGKKRQTTLRNTPDIGSLSYVDYRDGDDETGADCWYPLFSPDGLTGAADFAPEDIRDLVSADLWIGTNEPGLKDIGVPAGRMLHCEEKETLSELEDMLSGAKEMKGQSACPFYTALYLTRSDGTVGTVFPATDSCASYTSGSVCYELPRQANDRFWNLVKTFDTVTGE